MMLNDVVKLKNCELSKKIQVTFEISYYFLQQFKENVSKKYGEKFPLSEELIDIISDYNRNFGLQHHSTSSLIYNGREPRRDVLLKLQKIVKSFDCEIGYPLLSRRTIQKIIKTTLNSVDIRTSNRYFKCVKTFVERKIGQKLSYYSIYNVDGLKKVINDKLNELDSTQ